MATLGSRLIASLIIIFLISSCSQTPIAKKQNKQLATTSVWNVNTKPSKGLTFSLAPKYVENSSLTMPQQRQTYAKFSQAIRQLMTTQGYRLKASASDLKVGFAIVLAADTDDSIIVERFGVTPRLHGKNLQEKGSLLIYIEDTAKQRMIWRGTVQGFIHEEFTTEERAQRIKQIVNNVLSQFFN